jgi:hypothetical protein
MTSLAVTRTVPCSSSTSPDADRCAASTAAAMASADGINLKPASVGDRPSSERVKSLTPSDASSAATWRPMVGCVVPRARAALDRLPTRTTVRNARDHYDCGSTRRLRSRHHSRRLHPFPRRRRRVVCGFQSCLRMAMGVTYGHRAGTGVLLPLGARLVGASRRYAAVPYSGLESISVRNRSLALPMDCGQHGTAARCNGRVALLAGCARNHA